MRARVPVYVARRAKAAIAAVAVVAAIALAASGCGRASAPPAGGGTNGLQVKPPDQVVRDAVAALQATRSVQMMVSPQPSFGPFKLAKVQYQGDVTILTFARNGASLFALAFVGGKDVYIQFSQEMLQQVHLPGLFKRLAAGHWLKMPRIPRGLPAKVLPALKASELENHGPLLPTVRQTTLNGRKVVVVTDRKTGAKLYVANTGRAYPLLLAGPPGRVALSDYGASFDVPTPANTLPAGTTYTGPSLI